MAAIAAMATTGLAASELRDSTGRTDDELVARVREGDHEAFAALVDRHKRQVYGLAYRMLGDRSDAEDAAQEAFVRAYTRLATYQPDGRFGAWLLAIASHRCIDLLRSRGRRTPTVALGKVAESDRFISQIDEPEELAIRAAVGDDVRRWLATLPPAYRLVLTLRYFHELSYSEIAATLGEPVSTVRMRLFRARGMIQAMAARESEPLIRRRHPLRRRVA
jgi:RNA polymerase sigma-70 factor (ECF subfamily)